MITAQMKREYLRFLGPMNKDSQDGLADLIVEINADAGFKDRDEEVAYLLATVWYESLQVNSGKRFLPVIEGKDEGWKETDFERDYGFGTAAGKALGNTAAGDGAWYKGRGYVPYLTQGKTAYDRVSRQLLKCPGLHETAPFSFATHLFAYKVLALGMREGAFTGKKLGDFRKKNGDYDFVKARAVITTSGEGAEEIAAHARGILKIFNRQEEKEAA